MLADADPMFKCAVQEAEAVSVQHDAHVGLVAANNSRL
jgi:hypothetical protein